MSLYCPKCSNILKDPIECNYCLTNYCKDHIKNLNFCPTCMMGPLSYKRNPGIIKMVEKLKNEKINKLINGNNEMIECIICSLKLKPGHFCYHLAEDHKKELIENFSRKKSSKIEKEMKFKKMPYRNGIQDKNFDIKNFKTYNQNHNNDNKNNNLNHIYPNNSINKNNKNINNSLNLEQKNFQKCYTRRNYEKFSDNILNKNLNNNLYYCNKKNESINCDCCLPDRICRIGNCLCIDCMKHNIDLFNLEKGILFNKSGIICRPENGEYHCGRIFNIPIKNSVGQNCPNKKKCSFKDKFCCKECHILNKYKRIYLDKI